MKEHFKKGFQGLIVSSVIVAIFVPFYFDLVFQTKIYCFIILAIIASIFQPAYAPFKSASGKKDKGTALQIVWSVYFSQLFLLGEAIFFNRESAFSWHWYSYLGLFFAGFGVLIRSWAYLELGQFFTWHVSVKSDQTVVSTGPYRFVCHPSYTGAFLTYLFNCVLFHSWISAGFAICILFYAFYRRIKVEEVELIEGIGPDYIQFINSRKRLIPFVW